MWGVGKARRWRDNDLLLIEALHLYEAGLCKECGQPLVHSADIANTREFEAADDLCCRGCEVVKARQDQGELGGGQKLYVVNYMSD